jgi:molybdopterin-guanine dinucleotide biosynthesis protein A
MRIAAVIIAGGRSSRMGREKAVLTVGGRTILSRVLEKLGGQVAKMVINANDTPYFRQETGLDVIEDIRRDLGTPLAGLHAALNFAARENFDAVLTVPCDCPFLPLDLVSRLAATDRPAAIAASGGQAHYLTGLWSSTLRPELERRLTGSVLRRMQDWACHCEASVVEWPDTPFDPFFNINTPGELAEAQRIAAEFQT